MQHYFTSFDWCVLIGYFAGIVSLGVFFHSRSKSSDGFTAGGRSLPGWLCGLSIFATYLSSISYLALPGKSFVDNWNPFIYSLAIPPAALIAVIWFLPYYRKTGEVSAYAMLEKRFGTWARVYASGFYLLFQIARMGVVMYLMALPMSVIFGWDIRLIIFVTGIIVTMYAFFGGIVAVIWADAIQAIVLLAGAIIALLVIVNGIPGGANELISAAGRENKFSLGSADVWVVSKTTIWVMLAYGLMDNLRNFGIDQSYIQRYISAANDKEARRSLWIGALLYVPVSALFFLLGTALFVFYQSHPDDLPEVRRIVASQQLIQAGTPPTYEVDAAGNQSMDAESRLRVDAKAETLSSADIGDRVFPHFIAAHLPPGLTGLLIAAIFAAAMSTVSTSLNSSATLVMSDFYQRFVSPKADDRKLMKVLYGATIVWGVLGTSMALILIRITDKALDIWWTMSSVLGAGILGLFLLGMTVRRAGNRAAITAVVCAGVVIAWMAVSPKTTWPEGFKSPFHSFLIIVIGSLLTVVVGLVSSLIFKKGVKDETEQF